jgi:methylase of polypeptide subunit release factors
MSSASQSLFSYLRSQKYQFTTVTPLTHSRVLKNKSHEASSLRDVFGWSLPFRAGLIPESLEKTLKEALLIEQKGSLLQSRVRVSSMDNAPDAALFLHSAYPTDQDDAVFFGPDTYRFVRFMKAVLKQRPPAESPRILDIGCGSGVGGLMVSAMHPNSELVLNDINPQALKLASYNAENLGLSPLLALGDSLSAVDGSFDLILANPPFLVDKSERAYRHGGDGLGRALAVRMVTESLPRLNPGGRMLLYTGVAIVEGQDDFLKELAPVLNEYCSEWKYQEIDPDIFGEELEEPAYKKVDRIAAVGLEARRR